MLNNNERAKGDPTYLADKEKVLKDRAVNLHHHDILSGIGVNELLTLHLAGLDNHHDLLLDLVEGRAFRSELYCVNTEGDDKDEGLVVVRPELFECVPIK